MQEPLGGNEREVGERQGQRGFGQPIVADPRHDGNQKPADADPENASADERHDKLGQPARDVGLAPDRIMPEQNHEQRDRRGVVEQRLALDQPGEPRRRADVAKDCNDRRRIGGCDDRAEQQAHDQLEPPASGHNEKPMTAVVITVAMTASNRIGAASSSVRRTSVAKPASNTSNGRKT